MLLNEFRTVLETGYLPAFIKQYNEKYTGTYGNYRIDRITEVVEDFLKCGDFKEGEARVKYQNKDCNHDYFVPLSCLSFYLCPFCHQKRTLLFGEHIANEVMLKLPHRQFDEAFHGQILFKTPKYNDYFKENFRVFDATCVYSSCYSSYSSKA